MDPLLTLGPDAGFGFYLATAVVVLVNVLKAAFYKWGGKWKIKIPPTLWVVLSFLIAAGLCYVFKVNILARVLGNTDLPTVLKAGPIAYLLSGGAIALSSNVLYKVAVKYPENNKPEKPVEIPMAAPPEPVVEPIPTPVPEVTTIEEERPELRKLEQYVKLLTTYPNGNKPEFILAYDDKKSRWMFIKIKGEL